MSLKPRVVVVDHSTETADVLQAVFAPRGVEVERRHMPNRRRGAPQDAEVFVLDEERLTTPSSLLSPTPAKRNRVVLGSPESPPGEGTSSNDQASYIPKPFQYAELIRAVEMLLAQRDAQVPDESGRRAA